MYTIGLDKDTSYKHQLTLTCYLLVHAQPSPLPLLLLQCHHVNNPPYGLFELLHCSEFTILKDEDFNPTQHMCIQNIIPSSRHAPCIHNHLIQGVQIGLIYNRVSFLTCSMGTQVYSFCAAWILLQHHWPMGALLTMSFILTTRCISTHQ